jgi:hypothetical protein
MIPDGWTRLASGILAPSLSLANNPISRWAPCGGGCCGDTCRYFREVFGGTLDLWTQVSGSWSIVSDTLQTTSASGVCTVETLAPNSELEWGVVVTWSGDTEGDKLRVIGNYVDSSNYTCAEFTIGDVAGDGGEWKIIERIGGGEDTLVTVARTIPEGSSHTVYVYFTATTCTIYEQNGLHTFAEITAPTTSKSGLGTGSTLAGTATFDTFELWRHQNSDPTCPYISVCEACGDDIPATLKVTVQGVTDRGVVCTCSDVNGVYDDVPYIGEVPWPDDAPPAACTWRMTLDPSPACSFDILNIRLTASSASVSFGYMVGATYNTGLHFSDIGLPPPGDCMELDITIDGNDVFSYCYASSATAHLEGPSVA